MGKVYSPEQVVRKLREVESKLANGFTVPEVAWELGISDAAFQVRIRIHSKGYLWC